MTNWKASLLNFIPLSLIALFLGVIALCFLYIHFSRNQPKLLEYSSVAYVEQVEGSVRVKLRATSKWQSLKEGSYLSPGTQVYVPVGALVDLNYFRHKVRVAFAKKSYFRIHSEPPGLPKFRREFLALNQSRSLRDPLELDRDTLKNSFDRLLNHPKTKSKKVLSATTKDSSGSFAVLKETKPLDLMGINKTLRYFTRGETAFVDIRFKPLTSQEFVFAYIWNEDRTKPIWSGISKSHFQNIALKPGNYVFQAFSESENYVSNAVDLKVRHYDYVASTNDFSKLNWPEDGWETGEVRVFQ